MLSALREVNAERSLKAFGTDLHDWSAAEWGNAIAGEVGEMCNLLKKQHLDGNSRKEDIAKEAADIVVYLDLLCEREGIDLRAAIRSKFNEVSEKKGVNIFI
jgi:NTP pyrophosphatase (non-canonical NTP hydrolase)